MLPPKNYAHKPCLDRQMLEATENRGWTFKCGQDPPGPAAPNTRSQPPVPVRVPPGPATRSPALGPNRLGPKPDPERTYVRTCSSPNPNRCRPRSKPAPTETRPTHPNQKPHRVGPDLKQVEPECELVRALRGPWSEQIRTSARVGSDLRSKRYGPRSEPVRT